MKNEGAGSGGPGSKGPLKDLLDPHTPKPPADRPAPPAHTGEPPIQPATHDTPPQSSPGAHTDPVPSAKPEVDPRPLAAPADERPRPPVAHDTPPPNSTGAQADPVPPAKGPAEPKPPAAQTPDTHGPKDDSVAPPAAKRRPNPVRLSRLHPHLRPPNPRPQQKTPSTMFCRLIARRSLPTIQMSDPGLALNKPPHSTVCRKPIRGIETGRRAMPSPPKAGYALNRRANPARMLRPFSVTTMRAPVMPPRQGRSRQSR